MNRETSSQAKPPSSPKKGSCYPGGGKTFFGKFQRVKIEGRRGRSYWEWKSAESKKERCGHEGDDEMTSLESDTLKRPPVGRWKEEAHCHPTTCGIKVLPPFLSPDHECQHLTEGEDTHNNIRENSEHQKPLKSILVKGNSRKEHQSPQNSYPSAPPKELACAAADSLQEGKSKFILGHRNKSVDCSSHTKYFSERDTKPSTNQYRSAIDPEKTAHFEKGNKSNNNNQHSGDLQKIKVERDKRYDNGKGNACFVNKKDTFSKEDNYLKCQENKPLYPIISKSNLICNEKYSDNDSDENSCLHAAADAIISKDTCKQPVECVPKKPVTSISRVQVHSQSRSSVSVGNRPSQLADSKKQSRKSGALVWVNQPGGGAKLEWIPTAGLSTIRTVPTDKPVDSKKLPSSSSQLKASDNGVAGLKERAPSPSTKTSVTRDDQGERGRGDGKGKDDRIEREARAKETDVARAASSALSAGCDGSAGHCEANDCLTDRNNRTLASAGEFASSSVVTLGNAQSPKYSRQKNVYSSVPGETRPAGRTNPLTGIISGVNFRNSHDSDSPSSAGEDRIVSVAGRNQGQVVRIRVRPEVHAYLSNLPVIHSGIQYRRDSFQSCGSSASAITWGSGEGCTGYQEEDYSAVVDEYTLLKKAVDEQDPEALRLLTETESALSSGKPSHVEKMSSFEWRPVSYPCMEETM